MKIYFAADHAGFEIKNQLLVFVRDELHYEVEDCGAFVYDKDDDYPAIIASAGRKLASDARAGRESRAIVAGASGQGEAIAMNRFRGVRCALYYGEVARTQTDMSGKTLGMLPSTRVHNNANALSLGLRFLSFEEAREAVASWLATEYPGETRHQRRVQALDTIE